MPHRRIITDPSIASGAPVIQGTPFSVPQVLERIAAIIPDEFAQRLLGLETADIKAALEYAATALRPPEEPVDQQHVFSLDEDGEDQGTVELDPKRILVVDDLEQNLTMINYMFKNSGFSLSMASSAQEAMQKAWSELPILIISDIQMPGTSGLDLLAQLKADDRTKNIAVILVTAHHLTSNEISQGLTMGADEYILRPFTPVEFMSRVEAVIRLKWAELETRRQAQAVARRNLRLKFVNELALAVNSLLGVQGILAVFMQKLAQLLGAEAVSLLFLNEEKHQLAITISSNLGKRVSLSFDIQNMELFSTQLLRKRIPRIVSDVLKDHQAELELTSIPGEATIQAIPMISKEQIIGALAVINKRGGNLDDVDWVLLNSTTSIIAVAVENAHLLESTQRQVDDLIALNEIGRALTSTLDLEQILKQTSLLVQRSLQAEAASLWLLDEESQELVLIASSGLGSDGVTGFRLPLYDSIAGHVAQTGESYISADIATDKGNLEYVAISNYEPRSLLCVPVQGKGQIIGVMQALHQKANWFDQNDLRLTYPVASSVAIAFENARLFNEVQAFNQQLEGMVTERTRELAEEKEKTEAILASMADGLVVLDAEHCIVMANKMAESMLDLDFGDLQGRTIGPKQLENPLWRCINDISNNPERTVSALVDTPLGNNGGMRSTQAHSAKMQNEDDQIIGTVIVLRDITALKEVEWMKARFMAGVTHELKTPLSIIRLHANNLRTYYDRLPDAKKEELLRSIQGQTGLLERLIEDILQLSRLDAGIESKHEPLDLVELIDQVVAHVQPLAEEMQLTLTWQKPSTEVMVLADAGQLESVATNLIDNAIKYTPAGGIVEVEAFSETANQQVVAKIRVTDTGVGIPPEVHAQVFERFHRIDPSHTMPGSGLGLSIVKEIVNAHGGEVQLESTPGVGSKFVVVLPGVEPGP